MKKYVDNFMQYRFLLSELVKKGIKLKYRRSYLAKAFIASHSLQ